jgi:hypothetical protein
MCAVRPRANMGQWVGVREGEGERECEYGKDSCEQTK